MLQASVDLGLRQDPLGQGPLPGVGQQHDDGKDKNGDGEVDERYRHIANSKALEQSASPKRKVVRWHAPRRRDQNTVPMAMTMSSKARSQNFTRRRVRC